MKQRVVEPATPAAEPRSGSSSTEGFTQNSIWRSATVVADYVEPLGTVSDLADAPIEALAAPQQRYSLREVLGVGGMGEVRLCRDEAIGRDIALKTLLNTADERRAQRRLIREVRVQGQLEHPSVVPVYDMGVAEGGMYFTMRRVRGRTMAAAIAALAQGDAPTQASYSQRRLLEAFVRVCLTVDYAHTRGVLHRDLKPANIMLGDFGEVYVLDWGIARLATAHATDAPVEVAGDRAGEGNRSGTPGYMAPEQILGLDDQDARTDVYALGTILFEILTMRPLYRGTSEEMAQTALSGPTVRASSVADVPPELDAVVERATTRERDGRFDSARQLAEAVEQYLDGHRDVERRRQLALARVETARAAIERESAAPKGSAEEARAEALREVVQALALDPEQREARGLLVKLLLEVPDELPPSVEQEIERASLEQRWNMARFGLFALMAWAVTIPFVAQLGILDWRSFAVASGLCTASAVYAFWMWRNHAPTTLHRILMATLVAATCGSLSCWLGPFVLVPTAAATTTIWFALHAGRRERWYLMFISGLGILVPFLLEWLGWIPRSFSFEHDRLVLHARALHLPPRGTTLALVYSAITFCIGQPILLGGLRDALNVAERKLFLQAWHLRQLVPDSPER